MSFFEYVCWGRFIKSSIRTRELSVYDIIMKNDKASYEEAKILVGKST
jgi:hypothetical protein